MSLTVYIVEKNERDLLIFHEKTCWYAGERVINSRTSYTTSAAFKIFRRVYPELTPCRHCCAGLSIGFYTEVNNSVPTEFNLENWLKIRK